VNGVPLIEQSVRYRPNLLRLPVRELCVGGTHAAEKLTQLSICNDEIVENVVRNNEGVAHVGLRDVIPLLDLQR
jgi:hypothetical protein